MASQTIRKNFTMMEEIANKLEFLSEVMHKKQSQVIQDLILQESKKYENSKKLERLERMHGKLDGLLSDVSMQKIKSQDV